MEKWLNWLRSGLICWVKSYGPEDPCIRWWFRSSSGHFWVDCKASVKHEIGCHMCDIKLPLRENCTSCNAAFCRDILMTCYWCFFYWSNLMLTLSLRVSSVLAVSDVTITMYSLCWCKSTMLCQQMYCRRFLEHYLFYLFRKCPSIALYNCHIAYSMFFCVFMHL